MRISILPYIVLVIITLIAFALGTIFWSLDSIGFAALEARFDLSDAILSIFILILMAILPMRKRN